MAHMWYFCYISVKVYNRQPVDRLSWRFPAPAGDLLHLIDPIYFDQVWSGLAPAAPRRSGRHIAVFSSPCPYIAVDRTDTPVLLAWPPRRRKEGRESVGASATAIPPSNLVEQNVPFIMATILEARRRKTLA